MNNLMIYKESSDRTLSSAQKLGHYFVFVACALTLSTSHPLAEPVSNNLDLKEAVVHHSNFSRNFESVQTNSIRDVSFEKADSLPDLNLEWVDSEIDTFMASLSAGKEINYSDELLGMAEEFVKNNPQAFKDFL